MGLRRIPNAGGQTFSDGIAVSGAGELLYVSGQLPTDDQGHVIVGDAEGQARLCFDNIERVLREFGADLRDVVRVTAYLTDLDDYAIYNRVRGERFGDTLPASTAVQVVGLVAGAHLEVEAIAFIAQEHRRPLRAMSPTP